MKIKKYEVPVDKARWECDPEMFDFECTRDLAPLQEFISQERATRAVEFGMNMTNTGYNIHCSEVNSTGLLQDMLSPSSCYAQIRILEEEIIFLVGCLDFALPLLHRFAATDDVADIYTAADFIHRHHQAAYLTSV